MPGLFQNIRDFVVQGVSAAGNKIDLLLNPDGTLPLITEVVDNVIESILFDLNAAPFSQTTNITNDYRLSRLEINFSTRESRDITITTSDGTILDSKIGNTSEEYLIDFEHISFNADGNITVALTQTAGACTATIIMTANEGSVPLSGNPKVTIDPINDNIETFEALTFMVGDSPALINLNLDLGRNGTQFTFINNGPGALDIEHSNNGVDFGGKFRLKADGVYAPKDVVMHTFRITHTGADSSYNGLFI